MILQSLIIKSNKNDIQVVHLMMHYVQMLCDHKFNKTWKMINISNLIISIENIYLPKHCKIIDFINIFFQLIKSWFSNFSFYKYRKSYEWFCKYRKWILWWFNIKLKKYIYDLSMNIFFQWNEIYPYGVKYIKWNLIFYIYKV